MPSGQWPVFQLTMTQGQSCVNAHLQPIMMFSETPCPQDSGAILWARPRFCRTYPG